MFYWRLDMSITHTTDSVAIWLDSLGAPARMVWAGRRFRVSDTPTRLGPDPELPLSSAITHPPRSLIGWRFQGTSADGESHIFDVRRSASSGDWQLFRVID
jgi:hypothetical protein